MSPLLAFLVKLPLALLVFLLIAYAGTASRRIAGVLFTFPILNGIAIIASDQPIVVADAIYPLVIFNCVLFAFAISFPRALPPLDRLPRWGKLFARITAWALAWLVGALVITAHREQIFSGSVLLAGAAVFALGFLWLAWSRSEEKPAASIGHVARFISFWATRTGMWRVIFFIVTYAVLFFASHAVADQKWVGMASALPLPGFFALAALIDDAEAHGKPLRDLKAIRDTLFLGPLLVIPFNWTFAHALVALPPDAALARYLLLFALWALAALAVVLLVPRLAHARDRR